MKAKIYCFGNGWAIEVPGEGNLNGRPVDVVHYMGQFEDCIEHLDKVTRLLMNKAWRDSCTMNRLGFQEIGSA